MELELVRQLTVRIPAFHFGIQCKGRKIQWLGGSNLERYIVSDYSFYLPYKKWGAGHGAARSFPTKYLPYIFPIDSLYIAI